jgi:hypothetical protein
VLHNIITLFGFILVAFLSLSKFIKGVVPFNLINRFGCFIRIHFVVEIHIAGVWKFIS